MSKIGLAAQNFIDHGVVGKFFPVVEGEGVKLVSMANESEHDRHGDVVSRSTRCFSHDGEATVSFDHGNQD